jgi:predicted PurR-regulated permease PerM
VSGLIDKLPPPLRGAADELVARLPKAPGANIDETVQRQVNAQGPAAAEAVGAVITATGSFFFDAAMMLIALFFLLVHGDACVSWLDNVSPLKKGQTRELLREFKRVSYSVIVSTIITSGVQAAAALVGYYIAGVPHPVFFGAVTFFVAFIPAIGAGGVCLTASLLMLLTGHPYAALFLAIWAVTVVGLIDNIVKPFLIKNGMELHGSIVFFALIGGLLAFGATGLLIGPLIVALVLALLRIYHRDFSPDRPDVAPNPPGGHAP